MRKHHRIIIFIQDYITLKIRYEQIMIIYLCQVLIFKMPTGEGYFCGVITAYFVQFNSVGINISNFHLFSWNNVRTTD